MIKNFRDIKKHEMRIRILNKAEEIFARKGYSKTRFAEIAKSLDMSVADLNTYFTDKKDLFYECALRAIATTIEVAKKIVHNNSLTPLEKVRLFIKEHVKVLIKKHMYVTLEQHDYLASLYSKNKIGPIIKARDEFQKMFMSILQEGIKDGSFRKIDIKIVGFTMLGAVNWVSTWYSTEGSLSPEVIGNIQADYLIRGLLHTN